MVEHPSGCPPAACRQPVRRCPYRLPGEATQSYVVDIPELVRASLRCFLLQGNGPVHTRGPPLRCGPMARRSRFPNLGCAPVRVAGARTFTVAHRVSPGGLYAFCTSRTMHSLGAL